MHVPFFIIHPVELKSKFIIHLLNFNRLISQLDIANESFLFTKINMEKKYYENGNKKAESFID